jgi:hypothetical protein
LYPAGAAYAQRPTGNIESFTPLYFGLPGVLFLMSQDFEHIDASNR